MLTTRLLGPWTNIQPLTGVKENLYKGLLCARSGLIPLGVVSFRWNPRAPPHECKIAYQGQIYVIWVSLGVVVLLTYQGGDPNLILEVTIPGNPFQYIRCSLMSVFRRTFFAVKFSFFAKKSMFAMEQLEN